MKQINLIPRQAQERAARRKTIASSTVAALIAIGLVIGLKITIGYDDQILQESLEHRQTEKVTKATSATAQAGVMPDLSARIAQYNTLAKTEISWSRTFAKVAGLLPKDIRLLSYSFGSSSGQMSFKMTGEAPSNLSFAVFMESLKSSPVLLTPAVEGYTYSPTKGNVVFSVTGTLPLSQIDYSSKN